jgi:hypothetical protein
MTTNLKNQIKSMLKTNKNLVDVINFLITCEYDFYQILCILVDNFNFSEKEIIKVFDQNFDVQFSTLSVYRKKTIKDLKKGEFFTLKPLNYPSKNQVYIKDSYDKSEKKYLVYAFSDISKSRLLKSDAVVYTNFIF